MGNLAVVIARISSLAWRWRRRRNCLVSCDTIDCGLRVADTLADQQSSQGNVQGSKQDAVGSAAQMALKMFMKSQMSGGGGGLMSMASKFM